MKRLTVQIDRLVVDAAGIAPLHGEQFRVLVEQALQQHLKSKGVPSAVATNENVTVAMPALIGTGHAGGIRLAGHVATAIHRTLTRKASGI